MNKEETVKEGLKHRHLNSLKIVEVGSTAWGISTSESGDDLDLIGVHLSPMTDLLGLGSVNKATTWRSKPQGVRSEPGDVDYVSYSLHKFLGMALKGNPSVQALIYTSPENIHYDTGRLDDLDKEWFVSKRTVKACLSYAWHQYECLTGKRTKSVNRPELVERYGFDTKYATHILRLLLLAQRYLEDGTLVIPLPDDEADMCKKVRNGKVHYGTFLNNIEVMQKDIEIELLKSDLPDEPNKDAVENWVMDFYSYGIYTPTVIDLAKFDYSDPVFREANIQADRRLKRAKRNSP